MNLRTICINYICHGYIGQTPLFLKRFKMNFKDWRKTILDLNIFQTHQHQQVTIRSENFEEDLDQTKAQCRQQGPPITIGKYNAKVGEGSEEGPHGLGIRNIQAIVSRKKAICIIK